MRNHQRSFQFPASSFQLLMVGFFLSFTLTGCSVDYAGERLFWKAQQLYVPLVKNAQTATPDQYANTFRAFEAVVKKTPGTIWAPRAHLAIGTLYVLQKQYSQARQAYALVLQNYNQYKELCLNARVGIAKTYEVEQHWPEAANAYREIAEYHPWSPVGLQAPLSIARLAEQGKVTEPAAQAYQRAAQTYIKLLVDAPNPELATQVKSALVLAYQRLGEWEQAVELLQELADIQTGTNRPLVLMTLGAIYQAKLRNTGKAQAAYTKLAAEFPDHPFGKAAQAQLNQLGATAVVPAPAAP